MDAGELDLFILEVVDAQPATPRDFDRGPLLVHCTLNAPSALMLGLGAVTLGIVSRFTFTGALAPGQSSPITAFAVVMGALGIGLILLPFATYVRFVAVLRDGVLTTARIVEAQPAEDDVVAAIPHRPAVVGRRVVEHPSGPFEEPFTSTAAYAPALLPGVEVAVLVHPHHPRVLRELRPVR